MPRTDVQELGKLGLLVQHFKQEHHGKSPAAFFQFLVAHYTDEFNGNAHNQEQHSHQDLPLHNLSASVVPVLHAEPSELSIVAAEKSQINSHYREPSWGSAVRGDKPWQPPKKG